MRLNTAQIHWIVLSRALFVESIKKRPTFLSFFFPIIATDNTFFSAGDITVTSVFDDFSQMASLKPKNENNRQQQQPQQQQQQQHHHHQQQQHHHHQQQQQQKQQQPDRQTNV